jgi:hypothetical protein
MKKNNNNGNRKKKTTQGPERRFFTQEDGENVAVLRRKLVRYDAVTASTGNTLGYFISSSGASSVTDWASLAAIYDEYRVRGIRVRLCPVAQVVFSSNLAAGGFIGAYPGPVVSASYANGTGATNTGDAWAQSNSKVHGCNEQLQEHVASWALNPSAKLWVAIASSVPSQQEFGVEYVGTQIAAAGINATVTHFAFVEFDIEFRGRN